MPFVAKGHVAIAGQRHIRNGFGGQLSIVDVSFKIVISHSMVINCIGLVGSTLLERSNVLP